MKTTDSRHDNPVAPNLLARDFTADAANSKWVADITGIETQEGDLSLAAIVDMYSRFAVGWAMGKERDEQLGTYAAVMALQRRRPGAGRLASFRPRTPVHEPWIPRVAETIWN